MSAIPPRPRELGREAATQATPVLPSAAEGARTAASAALVAGAEELPLVRMKIEKSVELIESFVSIGIDRTMSLYNNLEFEL